MRLSALFLQTAKNSQFLWGAVCCLFLVACSPAKDQITIVVTAVPENTPVDAELFVAGDFQNWNPGSKGYRCKKQPDGRYQFSFTPSVGEHEFKLTRGSWETVEANVEGGPLLNRLLKYDGTPLVVEISILSWTDLEGFVQASTASENVHVVDEEFYMPQLERTRRISIYLPPDYASAVRSYPVLYLHDGQNVFDAATSFAGEWKVDETLDSLYAIGDYGCIAVAIDSDDDERTHELSPWPNARYGGGQGDAYINFIVETLKPHIDSTYRTLSQRECTAIIGSSLGGLISLYAGIEYPKVFGLVGSFSPAYWFSPKTHTQIKETPKQHSVRIYTIIGAPEGEQHIKEVEQIHSELISSGHSPNDLNLVIHDDGRHNEWYWAREFPAAYLWLFSETALSKR